MTRRADDMPLTIVRDAPPPARQSLTIGVVNNMPEAAFEATADQFDSLLRQAAPDGVDLHLRLFGPVDPASRRHEPTQDLWTAALDGLIVTGAEPQAARIGDEPCLPFLSRIVDWAEAGAVPTIWSCLAAHAAVYRMDGIERRPRDTKLFGVFECDKVERHPLLDGSDAAWTVPHSRLNELSEAQLKASGYRILTRSAAVGADTFVKQSRALHVFLNGHPEYGQATLRSEYRRDVRRYLLGERPHYPDLPTGYFPDDGVLEMAAFREIASARRAAELMTHFPTATAKAMPWRDTATSLFRNWLLEVVRRKSERDECPEVMLASPSPVAVRLHPSPSGAAMPHAIPDPMRLGRQTR